MFLESIGIFKVVDDLGALVPLRACIGVYQVGSLTGTRHLEQFLALCINPETTMKV